MEKGSYPLIIDKQRLTASRSNFCSFKNG